MLMRHVALLAFSVSILAIAPHRADAINWFLPEEDAPIAAFSDQEIDKMLENFNQAMNSAKDGETLSWSNDQSGHGGSTTVLETLADDQRDCRRAKVENYTAEKKAHLEFLFCRAEDGSWQVTTK